MRSLALAAALALASLHAPAGTVDLLANGGFEDGLEGWEPHREHQLVAEPDQAHSGEACLSGEVTEPQRALILRRTVPVKAACLYRFEAWARATNRTKLVLWVRGPGSRERRLVAAWRRVPRRWRRYATPITVGADGRLQLEVVAPSSYGEPPGRIWLDDLALYETPMPPVTPVSRGVGFNDEPALAQGPDGTLYVAWNSHREGADSLQVARYEPASLEPLGTDQVAGGEGTYLLGIRAVPTAAGAAVLYAAEVEGNWDLFAVPCRPQGPAQPVRLTSHPAVDVKPAAAWHQGTLWVAWESNRDGPRQVFAASLREGRLGEPVRVSVPEASSYSPAIAVLDGGQVAVAWHSFRENNYDVFLRRRSPEGTWSPERRLTRAPSIDRNAALLARGGELWLVYENAQTRGYHIGATNRRRLIVAQVTPDGLLAPSDYPASPLYGRCEAASPAFDDEGRLWLAFLRPRLPRAGWDVYLTCTTGRRWLQPRPVSAQKGMDRRPGLVLDGGRALLAFQTNDLPPTWRHVPDPPSTHSDVFLAAADLAPAPPAEPIALEPLAEPHEPFEAAQLRIARGEDAPTPTISYKGHTLKLFYGDLHEHSDISICNRCGDQSPDESYQHIRDIARYDFACITDHGYNQNPCLWHYSAKLARANHDPARFLTFLGQEWTSSFERYSPQHPYGYYGHRNLILADLYFPRWWNANNGQTPAELWTALRKMNADFVLIPHQLADTGNVPTDWSFHDETAQPVAEIFQTRGSYEHRGAPRQARRTTPEGDYFLHDAWARGILIGVIASPDHGGGMGKAAVYATELSRPAILDALRARQCFGTTAARIFLDVRVDGHLMGHKSSTAPGDSVAITVRARCPAPIDRIEICRNNQFIHTRRPEGPAADFTFVDRSPPRDRAYYYVRLVQDDGEIAWTSPVWLGATAEAP
ncbi:MAG: CehA/McbA family metallohydrolase [Candidatus Brocadiia bacterium]